MLVRHREAIRQAAARHKGEAISLVGSVARGDDHDDSDYDFLVTFAKGASLFDLCELELDLEELLEGEVDVVSVGGLRGNSPRILDDAIAL